MWLSLKEEIKLTLDVTGFSFHQYYESLSRVYMYGEALALPRF